MKHIILALFLVLSSRPSVMAQSVSEKLGLGLNLGGQLIYGDGDYKGGFGIGLETYLKYKLSERFSVTTALGYGELSDGTFHLDESNFTTNMLTFDVKGAYNLSTTGPFKPFVYLGLGVFNFKNDKYDERYNDGSVFLGGGFEYMINPLVGLTAQADYRYTTSEDLDNRGDNEDMWNFTSNDGYLNVRGGFTYYFGSSSGAEKPKVIAERVPLDEIEDTGGDDEELAKLIEGIGNLEESSSADFNMEEYIKLKSSLDQMNDELRHKGLEIEELRAQLESRKQRFTQLQSRMSTRSSAMSSSMNMDMSDFAGSYERALENCYAREYDAAVYLFSMLIETYPNHKLASNCQYWIGECYFGQKNYDMAIEAFNKVFNFSNSVKHDDALLMLGRCYKRMGNAQLAKDMFDRLMNEYPDSEYIQRAAQYARGL
jgi:tol-pal system protein YbgF